MMGNGYIVGWAILASILTAGTCPAEDWLGVWSHERELEAMFETIAMPEGTTAARLCEVELPTEVANVLHQCDAEWIIRAYPDIHAHVDGRIDLHRIYRVRFPDGTDLEHALNQLIGLRGNGVVGAWKIPCLKLSKMPNDRGFPLQWGLHNTGQFGGTPNADINAPEAWDITIGEYADTIGIIDTGVWEGHKDLEGKVGGDPEYKHAHGTNVAGIAAAKTNNLTIGIAGLNWKAYIWDDCVSESKPPYDIDPAQVHGAFMNCIDHGCDVINCSWGGYNYNCEHQAAVVEAYNDGIVVCASAGNDASSQTQYPAAYVGVLGVGATTDQDAHSPFSNWGDYIDVVAPGGEHTYVFDNHDIYTTTIPDTFTWVAGTSVAAPLASALASLLRGYDPRLEPDDISWIICYSAKDLGPTGWDKHFGYGRINARRALDMLRPPHTLYQMEESSPDRSEPGDWQERTFHGIPGFADDVYTVRPYRVEKDVLYFREAFKDTPFVWGRGHAQYGDPGYYNTDPLYNIHYTGVIDHDEIGAKLETYVYYVDGHGWLPCDPDYVTFAYTALGIPCETPNPPSDVKCTCYEGYGCTKFQWQDNSNNEDWFRLERTPPGPPQWIPMDSCRANQSYLYYQGTDITGYWWRIGAVLTCIGGEQKAYSEKIYGNDCEIEHGCPFVSVWNGEKFEVENNILPPHSVSDRTDYYTLHRSPIPEEGEYRLQIAEFDRDHSHFDWLELWAIDHVVGTEVGVNKNGRIMCYEDPLLPVSCIDGRGRDCLPLIRDVGNGYVDGQPGDILLMEFEEIADHTILAPVTSNKVYYSIDVKVRRPGGVWIDVATLHPRENWATNPLDLNLQERYDTIEVKFCFTSPHELDYVALARPSQTQPDISVCPLTWALHSELGEVTGKLSGPDLSFVELRPGQTVDLAFEEIPPPGPGMVRSFVLVSHGRYITTVSYRAQ
jgi:thermitase